jgi:dUTP pyrophosphatase
MATDHPENKKRKVSPEPDAGVSVASNLLIKRLSEKAKLPTRGSALAAGYDLYRWGHEAEYSVFDANFLRW